MAVEVILPRVDMDMATGKITKWYIAEGEPVAKGQALFEIEFDKAAMEIELPAEGVLRGVTGALEMKCRWARSSAGSSLRARILPKANRPLRGPSPRSRLRRPAKRPRRITARFNPLSPPKRIPMAVSGRRLKRVDWRANSDCL